MYNHERPLPQFKIMCHFFRRLRILSQWSDLPLVEKRKLISVGEAYRVMHPPYPTGKDRKRKVAPTDEVMYVSICDI